MFDALVRICSHTVTSLAASSYALTPHAFCKHTFLACSLTVMLLTVYSITTALLAVCSQHGHIACCLYHTFELMSNAEPIPSAIVCCTHARSLCIVDEFGKGTLTTDGVGLLAATLQHFAAAPVPPKLLACTHFSDLLNQPIVPR